jgi:hypothetical protein
MLVNAFLAGCYAIEAGSGFLTGRIYLWLEDRKCVEWTMSDLDLA